MVSLYPLIGTIVSYAVGTAADDNGMDNTREFEIKICKRLTSLQFILSELVKSNLQDVHAESLFKTLAKAYKTLHTLVKYVSGI